MWSLGLGVIQQEWTGGAHSRSTLGVAVLQRESRSRAQTVQHENSSQSLRVRTARSFRRPREGTQGRLGLGCGLGEAAYATISTRTTTSLSSSKIPWTARNNRPFPILKGAGDSLKAGAARSRYEALSPPMNWQEQKGSFCPLDQITVNTSIADWLVEHECCDRSTVEQMATQSREAWVPLGMILLREKNLSLKEVFSVLSEQAVRPKALFGDLAVELGACTAEQIDEAMATQREDCPHVLDLALASPEIDNEKLLPALVMYVRQIERVLDRLMDAVGERTTAAA